MTEDIDLSEIDKKYKDKCSLIAVGKCKNVNIFLQQSRENAELKEKIKKYAAINEQETKDYAELKAENERLKNALAIWENATQKQTALKVVEVDKYKQTLQEIKGIVSKIINGYLSFDEYYQLRQILDLITKVEEEKQQVKGILE